MKSEVEKKQAKFLMVLPLLALPFLTIAFVALGGGSGAAVEDSKPRLSGLTAEVPGAHLENKPLDKLGYYQIAKSDSSKKIEMMKGDPYYQMSEAPGAYPPAQPALAGQPPSAYLGYGTPSLGYGPQYADPNEARVYQRLNALNSALNAPPEPALPAPVAANDPATMGSDDVDRLEKMMQMMQGGTTGQDPELKQLSGMLENILDIQHPERVRKTSIAHSGQVFSVSTDPQQDQISMLVSPKTAPPKEKGFYGLTDTPAGTEQENSISAVVHQTQTLVDGAVIKLRLLTDVYINGIMVPRDSFLHGIANLSGERLSVKVESIRYLNSIFPVKLAVYDLDGLEGIHIPGAIGRDVAKQSGTNALQGLGFGGLNPSIGAQAASAGIELSKSLLSKKVKQIKVTIKAGYKVLLFDENQKNSN